MSVLTLQPLHTTSGAIMLPGRYGLMHLGMSEAKQSSREQPSM